MNLLKTEIEGEAEVDPNITIPLNLDASLIVAKVLAIVNAEGLTDGECIDMIHGYCTELTTGA